MPSLEVMIFNNKVNLSYKENEKDRLIKAIEILNDNWRKYSNLHGKVSDIKIASLISLELQDSINDLKKKIEYKKNNLPVQTNKEKQLETKIDKLKEELSLSEKHLEELNNELIKIKENLIKYKNE
tara:strand:- start:11313 stop:11690 length:378 start_codon:yes stop_codon:yes gene_type:complete